MHTCNTWEVQNHLQQCTLGALTLVCLIFETFTGRGRGWVWISSTTPFVVVPFCAISCQHYNPGPPALSAQPTDGLFITTWSSSLLTSQLRRTQLRPCQQSKSWSEHSYFLSRNISCNLLVQYIRFSWIMCKSGDHMARTCCKVLPVVFLVVAIKTAEQHLNSEVTIWQRYTAQFDILLRAEESQERELYNWVLQLRLSVQPMKVMSLNPFCCTIFTSQHSKLWSAPVGLFGPTAGCSSTVQRCYELWCSSQSWFLHLGLLEMNGVEHMQTNAFVHGDKAGSLAADLHSYTVCYCFPFVASCHSLCQSLIRTAGFRRLISHFSNFLTLHNERRGLKGTDWEEGEIQREKAWVRGNMLQICVCLLWRLFEH